MVLQWYAETPKRRGLQVCADVMAALGLLACVWLGRLVHGLVAKLADPGRRLEDAGDSLADGMKDAGGAVDNLPLVDDGVAAPFGKAEDASREIESAGQHLQDVVETLATALGWITGAIPALAIIFVWLLFRLHFARKAGRAVRLRDTESGPELLAIRAIARSSLEELASISTEDMKGWRTGDPIAIRNLASVELRRMGLKPYQR
jgi:hypothetical protein